MIQCIECGATFKPTGKGGRCLKCRRIYDRAWRAQRKAEGRPVKPFKMPREWHQAYEAEYYTKAENRKRRANQMREYTNNPELRPRHQARWIANKAIQSGKLERKPCEICGISPAQAHHDNYSQPLNVRWLCRKHHLEHHAKAEGKS